MARPITVWLDTYDDDDRCTEYGVEVASYDLGSIHGGYGGEVELASFATVHVEGTEVGVVPLAVALLSYAADRGWSIERATRDVEAQAYDAAVDREVERYEDEQLREVI
jgi:hypothetical protein